MQIDRRLLLAGAAALAAAPAWGAETPPRIRRLAPALDRVLDVNTPIETIATGIRWAEGPVWMDGGLLFTDPPANVIRRWTRAGGTRVWLSPSGLADADPAVVREAGANGLALDARGRLLLADSGSRVVSRLERDGGRTVLAARYRGMRFNSPNDLAVARSGAIYFTDPPYGLVGGDESAARELAHNGVYRLPPGGGEPVLVDGTLTRPNGVALSPDEARMYVSVSDEAAPQIIVYELDANGMPRSSRVWLDAAPLREGNAPGLPDGMKVAGDGTLFCTVPGGLMVLTPEAEPLGLIDAGRAVANCAIGEDGRTLFLAATDRILRVRLKTDARRNA